MSADTREKLQIVFGMVALSVPLGAVFASTYLTFESGVRPRDVADFDVFAIWFVTPFYLGYFDPRFYTCLTIIGVTALFVMFVTSLLIFRRKEHMGSAHWGNPRHMARAGYIKRYPDITGPIFGKTSGPGGMGKYLTNGDQPHSLVVAPTRAGKGVGVVIPTLLTFDGSILALDVKGELFEMTSRSRVTRGDRVYKFAPFDSLGRTNSYNPILDIVAMPEDRRFSETRRLAANLIAAKGKGSEGFIDGARDLFVAGVLYCIDSGTPTIGAVYDLFAQPGEKYKLFAELAENCKNVEAQRIFDNMAGNDTKILTSYTSVLGDGGLNLWADPLIKAATTTSDFSVYDLRRDPTSIFLCVSPNDLEVIAPLVRLFFQQVVSILQRSMPEKDEIFEVLFLLDEFKHLGKLEAIETAITTIAGYKGRFMFIIQSLSALTGAYEVSGKENFLSNTGVQVFMATADDETPMYISKAIGDYTFKNKSVSYQSGKWYEANISISDQGAPLLRPEQVRLLDEETEIVLIKGQNPMKLNKVKFYADRYLKKLFEAQTGPLPEPASILHSKVPASLPAPPPAEEPVMQPKSHEVAQAQSMRDEEDTPLASARDTSQNEDPEEEKTEEESDEESSDYQPTPEELRARASQEELLNRIMSLQKYSST